LLDSHPVDEGAIGAAGVRQHIAIVLELDPRVQP
jgi:hypothetical protein